MRVSSVGVALCGWCASWLFEYFDAVNPVMNREACSLGDRIFESKVGWHVLRWEWAAISFK